MTSGAERAEPALPPAIRTPLAIVGLVGVVVAVTLGLVFAGQTTGSVLDRQLAIALELHPTSASTAYAVCWILQTLADPVPAAVLVVVLTVVCLRFGRRRLAVLAVAGPAAADSIVIVMKHLVGRTIHDGSLTYPSTHAAQSVAFVMVVALLATALTGVRARAATVAVLGAAVAGGLVMGWALVAGSVHYATDTLGGFCIAVAVVPLAAWCIDRVGDRIAADRRVARTARSGRR